VGIVDIDLRSCRMEVGFVVRDTVKPLTRRWMDLAMGYGRLCGFLRGRFGCKMWVWWQPKPMGYGVVWVMRGVGRLYVLRYQMNV